MNIRRRNSLQKEIRDYIVPIVGVLLIIILLFSVFSGSDTSTTKVDLENKVGLSVNLDGTNTDSYIVYPGDFKTKIEGEMSLYKGEKVLVKEGNVNLSLLGLGDFKLNKLGEFKYLENGDFSLYSSDLWLNSISSANVEMRFATVKVGANSNISFSQNEMGSTIYLINGFAEIANLAGKSTVLANGQKITVSRLDANNSSVDLSLAKENIDDYYKQSDWFIINNGMSYIKTDVENNGTGTTSSGSISSLALSSIKLINFSNLSDESNVSSDTISISGNYTDDQITKISVNGINATINTELKTFKFDKVVVPNKENDLVFKVYDDANDILSKFIYTVYFDGAVSTSTPTSQFNVQTFNVDGSQFIFTNIKDGDLITLNGKETYTTYGEFLTLYGQVTAKGVKSVSVNDFTLSSFDGNTWRYHASDLNNNLSVGTNVYEVKYYGENGKILYTNHFTIIKKTTESKPEVGANQTSSDEVKING